jgi:hypothetical protein
LLLGGKKLPKAQEAADRASEQPAAACTAACHAQLLPLTLLSCRAAHCSHASVQLLRILPLTPCCCSASNIQGTPHVYLCCHAQDSAMSTLSGFADTGATLHSPSCCASAMQAVLQACCAVTASCPALPVHCCCHRTCRRRCCPLCSDSAALQSGLCCHKLMLPAQCSMFPGTGTDRHTLPLCHAGSPEHDMVSCAEISTVLPGYPGTRDCKLGGGE